MYASPHRTNREKHRKRRLIIIMTGLAAIAVLASLTIILAYRHTHPLGAVKTAPVARTSQPQSAASPTYTSTQGHYLFNGTIFWGRAIERDARKANNLGLALTNLGTFHPENYDAWIGDLECPVADMVVPYQRQVDLLNFNCPPDIAPYFIKYFKIIGLANNHTGDQGHDAFLETQQTLTKDGAQVYGSYDPSDPTNRCEIISLPIQLSTRDHAKQAAALPVAFCAYHYVGRQPKPGELEYITQYARIMPTIAFAHMGIEYTPHSTVYQEAVGHGMIDAGADFVIMNHPHWVQNTEAYKGKFILYSTGNFIFDQLTSEELRSASIDVTMQTPYTPNLKNWIKLGTDCQAGQLHDNCLTAAQTANLTKPKVSYKFSLVAGDELTQRWKPQLANPTIQQSVESRADWQQTMQALTY